MKNLKLILTFFLFSILTNINAQEKCNSCSDDNKLNSGINQPWGIGGGELIASPNANKDYLFYAEYYPSEPFCTSYGNKSYMEVWKSKIEPEIISAIKQHHLFKKAVEEGFDDGFVYELDGLVGGIVHKNFLKDRITERTVVVKLDIDIKQYINDFKSCNSFKNSNVNGRSNDESSNNKKTKNDVTSNDTENEYVYLKSPLQLLNEAENDLLTITDPLEKKLKNEQISFLRESSINVARANGDQVTATRLSIERDNENWNNFSESAGQLIGGLFVNAAKKREARRSQEYRDMMAKEKLFNEFPSYVSNLRGDSYNDLRKIINIFKKFPANTIKEEKQRILQLILTAGNTYLGTNTNESESNRNGLCIYIAEQKIKDAYFKGNTLHVAFSREVKDARFDHPVRVLGNRGYNKLKYFDIEKYILHVKASYNYKTGEKTVSLDFDWGVEKSQYASVESYNKFLSTFDKGTYFVYKKGGSQELLIDSIDSFLNTYYQTDFLGVLVMPKLLNEFSNDLSSSIALTSDDVDLDILLALATSHYSRKNYDKSIEIYKKAASMGSEGANYNLGVLYHNGDGVTKNHESAKYYYENALKINPNHFGANLNVGLIILGKENDIVEQMNNNLNNFNEYDRLNKLRKDIHKEALTYFNKAQELKPDPELEKMIENITSNLNKQ
ncbi:hypothetical protein KH5_12880 [Urechidicola sp. KH5]